MILVYIYIYIYIYIYSCLPCFLVFNSNKYGIQLNILCQCRIINKLTLVAKAAFLQVTEIILVQLMLKHIWKKNGFHYKKPPISQGEELYAKWKQELETWSIFMDLPKGKQGPAVFLTLPQNIGECVWHLATTDISYTDRLWVITNNLDEIHLRDRHTMAFK